MDIALDEARLAADRREVPVGAVIVKNGKILARAGNRTRENHDPSAHAEVLAIRAACAELGSERLNGADIYVTLEPCPACAAIISAARIRRVYYGAADPKSGGIEQGPRVFSHPQCHHKPEVYGGISEAESAKLLKEFFAKRRDGPPTTDNQPAKARAKLVPEIACADATASMRFYTDTLGFQILYQRPTDGFYYLERQGAEIMLEQLSDSSWLSAPLEHPFGRGQHYQIATADLKQLYAKCQADNAQIVQNWEEAWYRADDLFSGQIQFVVRDPDGYLLRFMQDLGLRSLPPTTGRVVE